MDRRRPGFTIVELIIVVCIICILASVGLVLYQNVVEKARAAEAYSVLADIAASETAYLLEKSTYTSNWTDLDRFEGQPSSDNFSYSLDIANGFGKATSTKGSNDYYMCWANGLHQSTQPSCP